MPQPRTSSRMEHRKEILRELTSHEEYSFGVAFGQSRAAEAIEAMDKIREGTYGRCTDCGDKIPAARMRAKPEATRCIKCQSERERQWVA